MVIRLVVLIVLSINLWSYKPERSITASSDCAAKAAMEAGNTIHSIQSGKLTRYYMLHVPPKYDPQVPTPVVFSLHGFASNAKQQIYFSKFDELSDQENFVAVFPEGTGKPLRWHAGDDHYMGTDKVDDVQFFRDMVKELETLLCVDISRIYVTGLSNGGGMTYRLACEMADTFAAVGTVAGAYSEIPGGCHPSRAIPVIAFHGTKDPIVSYTGQSNQDSSLPDIATWVKEWAVRNECGAPPEVIPAKGDASGIHYTNCTGDADVVFYTIEGGGHTWPGGNPLPEIITGKTSMDIDASRVMWMFFQAHPLEIGNSRH